MSSIASCRYCDIIKNCVGCRVSNIVSFNQGKHAGTLEWRGLFSRWAGPRDFVFCAYVDVRLPLHFCLCFCVRFNNKHNNMSQWILCSSTRHRSRCCWAAFLDMCCLQDIPLELFEMPSLTVLLMRNNPLREISAEVCRLCNLKICVISFGLLSLLPSEYVTCSIQ